MTLSTHSKEAIKTGLAMAIAYGIALQMDWHNPKWAGIAVAMISLSTAGESLNKGVMRMLGTLVGFPASITAWGLTRSEKRWAVEKLRR
ncbi:MAG: FUSC family protein [Deltaproteobacteria bacterium]|nr:FUSC family protein [Deltaproteobacteria bacterium]